MFSTGSQAISNSDGYFTYVHPYNVHNRPGSYTISILGVYQDGQSYTLTNGVAFGLEVSEWVYTNAWRYGASSKVKGGLVAYIQQKNSGGLELTLQESNPDIGSDDVVQMEEYFNTVVGAGVGVGPKAEVSVLGLRGELGGELGVELGVFQLGRTAAEFRNPYQPDEQKAQSIFLLASIRDSLPTSKSPLLRQLLKIAQEQNLPYAPYITERQVGLGLEGAAGAKAEATLSVLGLQRAELNLTLVDAGLRVLALGTLTEYRERNEFGVGFVSEHALELSLLSGGLGEYKAKLGLAGEYAERCVIELILDRTSNSLKRLEVSLTGRGNTTEFGGALDEVTVTLYIPVEQLGNERLARTVNILALLDAAQKIDVASLSIGPSALTTELNSLLTGLDNVSYEVVVGDGSEVKPELSLALSAGLEIDLGAGLSVKQIRRLVRERGVFINGKPYIREKYDPDTLISRPGRSWRELTLNALEGLWEYTKSSFQFITRQVEAGVQWTLDITSKTSDGILRGGATLTVPPDVNLLDTLVAGRPTIQATTPVTVSVVSWVPGAADFIVGGVYDFQAPSLTFSLPATLVITYTDEAAAGVDEGNIRLFQWGPSENTWRLVPAQADLAANTFTASITQLGTFALGTDAIPPEVRFIDPVDGAMIEYSLPVLQALVTDAGVGVDPALVHMMIDGREVAATYTPSTGSLTYRPTAPLAKGGHVIRVSASDILGNTRTTDMAFTISGKYVYLPLITRR